MVRARRWTVDVAVDEEEGSTRARMVLDTPIGNRFTGVGLVQHGQRSARHPTIAAELAIARALTDLTEELLEAAAADLESIVLVAGS